MHENKSSSIQIGWEQTSWLWICTCEGANHKELWFELSFLRIARRLPKISEHNPKTLVNMPKRTTQNGPKHYWIFSITCRLSKMSWIPLEVAEVDTKMRKKRWWEYESHKRRRISWTIIKQSFPKFPDWSRELKHYALLKKQTLPRAKFLPKWKCLPPWSRFQTPP